MRFTRTPQFDLAKVVVERLLAGGARDCMLVGGYVRDGLLGIESKDIDIEVYGLEYDEIVRVLSPHHPVDLVGRSFGVVKVGHQIDISIPRRESKIGAGHKGFQVHSDPTMSPAEAAARRDFTINAIGMRFDGTIVDPLDGRRDFDRGILRATGQAFKDDPLRVLRGMQFSARFGFEMDETTVAMCRDMVDEFPTLSQERVWEEWNKWATKGKHPSKGLFLLERTGWINNFPVLAAMRSTPQDPVWHPEGDVFTHTAHACDAAVEIAEREGFDSEQRTILMFAVLCHDFGKAVTTARNDEGRWVAPEHAERGRTLAGEFLAAMRAPGRVAEWVLPLVVEHMAMLGYSRDQAPSARVVRRLASRLAPATFRLWSAVCESDSSGRPPRPKGNPVAAWVAVADQLALHDDKPQPLLLGRHLIPLGYPPGVGMGAILRSAFEAQLDGEIRSVAEGLEWVQAHHPNSTPPGYPG
jgi:tRNA nucleotidyltransferase (CCA-adding enzyme)